jgi:hypothetical protein
MSFSLTPFLGKSEEIFEHNFLENVDQDNLSDREKEVINKLEESLKDLGELVGGHISLSAYGHMYDEPHVGDTLMINVAAVPDPEQPTSAQLPPVPGPAAVPLPVDTELPETVPNDDDEGVEPAPLVSPISSSGPDLGPSAVEAPSTPLPVDVPAPTMSDSEVVNPDGSTGAAPAGSEVPGFDSTAVPPAAATLTDAPPASPATVATNDTTAQAVRADSVDPAAENVPPVADAPQLATSDATGMPADPADGNGVTTPLVTDMPAADSDPAPAEDSDSVVVTPDTDPAVITPDPDATDPVIPPAVPDSTPPADPFATPDPTDSPAVSAVTADGSTDTPPVVATPSVFTDPDGSTAS